MKDVTEIYEELRAAFAERAGFVPSDGCDSAVRLYVLAAELQALQLRAERVLAESFPQTAQGKYLDYHAQTRALTRAAAQCAQGTLRFAAASAVAENCPIPAGTVCMTAEGVRFETTEEAMIEAGDTWADVPARAVEAGAAGNVVAGTVTIFSSLPTGVVQCTNPVAFTQGCDAEDDEALRARILASYRRLPNGANAAYYEQEAMDIAGVAAAKAIARARGIGTVDVIVAAPGGTPSTALLEAVESVLEEKREIAVDVQVLAPEEESVAVTAELKAAEGYSFAEAKANAERALAALFTGELLGKSVSAAHILSLLYNTEGVENVHMSAPTADTDAAADVLPVLGTVTLSEMEEA